MKSKKSIITLGVIFLIILSFVFNSKKVLRMSQKNSPAPIHSSSSSGFSIVIEEQNSSGQNGIVTFEPLNNQTVVKIKSIGYPAGVSEPAHIHLGTCEKPGEIKYPLVSLLNGESETILDADIGYFGKSSLILNVHKSNEEISTYLSCGNIQTL